MIPALCDTYIAYNIMLYYIFIEAYFINMELGIFLKVYGFKCAWLLAGFYCRAVTVGSVPMCSFVTKTAGGSSIRELATAADG